MTPTMRILGCLIGIIGLLTVVTGVVGLILLGHWTFTFIIVAGVYDLWVSRKAWYPAYQS